MSRTANDATVHRGTDKDEGDCLIGTQLYQKKSRVNLFLGLYGGLALIGIAYIVLVISRQQDVPGAAGFMVMFGAGMCFMTWFNSRKPRVIVRKSSWS